MSRRPHPAAICFLVLAALVLALGVWAQLQHADLAIARAAAGSAGADSVPVPVVLYPFEAGLVPAFLYGPDGDSTVFGVMAKIGGAFGLLGLLFLSLRGRSATEPVIVEEDVYHPPSMPAAAPQSAWQRRLAQKMATEAAPPLKPQRARSNIGRTLYRAVLILMGLAFAGLAVVAARGAGFSLDTIDVAALRGQVTTTLRLATEGDQQAIIRIASIAAAVVGSLIVLRVLLFRRKPVKRQSFAMM